MSVCDETRELLLDHVYEALEAKQAAAVEDHLAECRACADALVQAQADQALLAEATRLDGSALTFDVPAERPRRRRWRGAAAGLAFALAGSAVAAYHVAQGRIDDEFPVLSVTGPSVLVGDGVPFSLSCTSLDGDPSLEAVHIEIRSASGSINRQFDVTPDDEGRATFVVPAGDLAPGERGSLRLTSAAARLELQQSKVELLAGRVSTSKPLYRPGEVLRARVVVLERSQLTPPGGAVSCLLRLLDPRGGELARGAIPVTRGAGGWVRPLPPGLPGGEYTLELSAPDKSFPTVKQTFQVRTYRAPRLTAEIEFDRDAYGTGDSGRVWMSLERTEGGVPEGALVEARVQIDGQAIASSEQRLAASGRVTLEFTVPDQVRRGRASFEAVVRDGGVVETKAKTLPLVLDRLHVTFYPESGRLVDGLPTRVYFAARDPLGRPADLAFEVLDGSQAVVAEGEVTAHGMGRFAFTPRAGESYSLRGLRPQRVELEGALPAVEAEGTVLLASEDAYGPGAPLTATVTSTRPGEYVVSAYCRGALVAQTPITLSAGEAQPVSLWRPAGVGGVHRLTVLNPEGEPVAERLVSAAPKRSLRIEIVPSAPEASPGDEVTVSVRVSDERGRAVPAVLGVTVVDRAVAELAQDEDTPSLPMHFLLGLEVQELEEVDLYAGGPESAAAVDRLLGVQGWRRFAWKTPREFLTEHPDGAFALELASSVGEAVKRSNAAQIRGRVSSEREELRDLARLGAALLGLLLGLILASSLARPAWRRMSGVRIAGLSCPVLLVLGLLSAALLGLLGSFLLGSEGEYRPMADYANEPRRMEAARRPEDAGRPRALLALEEERAQAEPDMALGRGAPAAKRRRRADMLQDDAADFFAPDAPLPPGGAKRRGPRLDRQLLVREYVHRNPARLDAGDGVRRDFAEVLYWTPLLAVDESGEASLTFDLSDSVTTFDVQVEAHDARGALGAGAGLVRSRLPFYLEPKLPLQVGQGDLVLVPVAVASGSRDPVVVEVSVAAGEGLQLTTAAATRLTLEPLGRGRSLFGLRATQGRGTVKVHVEGRSGDGLRDASVRSIDVVPRGFPKQLDAAGVLEDEVAFNLNLPARLDPETLQVSLELYGSPVDGLVSGLESMLRKPGGCFEQASSSNYPNVMVLSYLQEQGEVAPAVARRAKQQLARGYKLLTGYECRSRGYEWFGRSPGHEALTAYGLMEFADMQAVWDVDPEMIKRTQGWLLARRDGKGGFRRNARALDSFGRAPQATTDAYVVWALTEADRERSVDLGPELDLLAQRAGADDDTYLQALAACALLNRGDDRAAACLERLSRAQDARGALPGATTSVTRSGGNNLLVETTALGALAFLKAGQLKAADRAARFLASCRRGGGGFGATQATILALKALTAHARKAARLPDGLSVSMVVNGGAVVRRIVADQQQGLDFSRELRSQLRPGANRVRLYLSESQTARLPWAMSASYHSDTPASDPGCPLALQTRLARDELREGETVVLAVSLRNTSGEGLPMTLARIGLPAGLEPRIERLNDLKERGAIGLWEVRPREVTLYWRQMAPGQSRTIDLELTAAVPGKYEGPASQAYLYYTDDSKVWVPPVRAEITPR